MSRNRLKITTSDGPAIYADRTTRDFKAIWVASLPDGRLLEFPSSHTIAETERELRRYAEEFGGWLATYRWKPWGDWHLVERSGKAPRSRNLNPAT